MVASEIATNGGTASPAAMDVTTKVKAFIDNEGDGTMSAPVAVPLDILQGTVDTGRECRWGILGAGRVCQDFVQALKSVPGAKVVAVGASSLAKAQEFATKHNIPTSVGSYAELVRLEEVDVVYVGTLHSVHKEHVMLALEARKHVLVEKPIACNAHDAQHMVDKAREVGVLMLEGMWTRFFPAYEMVRHLIASNTIGKVVALHADFGFNSSDSEPYPESPFFQLQHGGGGLLFLGPYPIAVAPLCFGSAMPTRVAAAGVKDKGTGVDLAAGITLEYEGQGLAVLTYNLQGETPEETTIVGTTGRIKIMGPAHCPTRFSLFKKHQGRGNVEERVFDYPLPCPPPSVPASGGFNYPNSNGFQFEAMALQRCVFAGLKEVPQFTLDETMAVARIMDEVRRQLGVDEIRAKA